MSGGLTANGLVPPGKLRLALLSFLSQLLALILIRLISSELRILAFFQHYLYAASFFGLALGCFTVVKTKGRGAAWLAYFTLISVGLAICHLLAVQLLGFMYEGSTYFVFPLYLPNPLFNELLMMSIIFVTFVLIIKCFTAFGRMLGSELTQTWSQSAPAVILGGVCLAWLFFSAALSIPFYPYLFTVVLIVGFISLHGVSVPAIAAFVVLLLCNFSFDHCLTPASPKECRQERGGNCQTFWTPYFQVMTMPYAADGKQCGFGINVNGHFLEPVIDPNADQAVFEALGRCYETFFPVLKDYHSVPYVANPKPGRVLILGAGAGVEAAAALANGAQSVDAVEGQSWLGELGNLNPARPYASPKVRRIICDPREFLRYTSDKYDLIVFGILESQTNFSPFGSLRTDNFIYTADSFYEAIKHLDRSGCLVVSYAGMRPWYTLRLAHNLTFAGGKVDADVRTAFRNYLIFAPGRSKEINKALKDKLPTGYWHDNSDINDNLKQVTSSTDDWPFTFAMAASMPRPYLVCLLFLLTAMIVEFSLLQRLGASASSDQEEAGGSTSPVLSMLSVCSLAAALMLFCERSLIILAQNLGTGWAVAAGGAVSLFALAAAAGILPAVRRPIVRIVLWVLLFASLTLDYLFNYEAVVTVTNPALWWLASAFLPVLPALPFGALMAGQGLDSRGNTRVPSPAVAGSIFMGFALALAFDAIAIYTYPVTLDLFSAALAALALLLNLKLWQNVKSGEQKMEMQQ